MLGPILLNRNYASKLVVIKTLIMVGLGLFVWFNTSGLLARLIFFTIGKLLGPIFFEF